MGYKDLQLKQLKSRACRQYFIYEISMIWYISIRFGICCSTLKSWREFNISKIKRDAEREREREWGGVDKENRNVGGETTFRGRRRSYSLSPVLKTPTSPSGSKTKFFLKNIYRNLVRTSQETYYVSSTKINRLLLFKEKTLFIVGIIRHIQTYSVRRM
jgi:hypothetical protein